MECAKLYVIVHNILGDIMVDDRQYTINYQKNIYTFRALYVFCILYSVRLTLLQMNEVEAHVDREDGQIKKNMFLWKLYSWQRAKWIMLPFK